MELVGMVGTVTWLAGVTKFTQPTLLAISYEAVVVRSLFAALADALVVAWSVLAVSAHWGADECCVGS